MQDLEVSRWRIIAPFTSLQTQREAPSQATRPCASQIDMVGKKLISKRDAVRRIPADFPRPLARAYFRPAIRPAKPRRSAADLRPDRARLPVTSYSGAEEAGVARSEEGEKGCARAQSWETSPEGLRGMIAAEAAFSPFPAAFRRTQLWSRDRWGKVVRVRGDGTSNRLPKTNPQRQRNDPESKAITSRSTEQRRSFRRCRSRPRRRRSFGVAGVDRSLAPKKKRDISAIRQVDGVGGRRFASSASAGKRRHAPKQVANALAFGAQASA